MSNTGNKGVDIRQTGNQLIFDAFETTSGLVLSSGTVTLELYELQTDGSLKSFDFGSGNSHQWTFVTTALATATTAMTQQSGNNSTTATGIWTYALTTLTGFTIGAMYYAIVRCSTADKLVQTRKFQYGSLDGDLTTVSTGTGAAALGFVNSLLSIVSQDGTATAGGNTTITLGAGFTGDAIPVGCQIFLYGGTGVGQWNTITGWVNSTLVATVARQWTTNPANGTLYRVWTFGAPAMTAAGLVTAASVTGSVGSVTGAVGSVTGSVGSVTGSVASVTGSVGSISGITFPTNFSSFSIDGSGRVLLQPTQTGVTIPSVTTVTGNVNGNVGGTVGSVTGAVGSVTGSVGSVAGSVAGDISGKVLGGGASSITGSGVQAASVVGSVGSVSGSVGSVTGSVGSVAGNVSGDVAGKVLGGGSSTITGDGARASSVTGAVGSVTGAVGSVTGNVGGTVASVVGNVGGSVASVTGNVGGSVASVQNVHSQSDDVANLIPARFLMTGGKAWVLNENGDPIAPAVATELFVDGPINKLKVNSDNSVNSTATVDTSGIAAAVATVLFVDGSTNQLKVNDDHSVNATVSGTIENFITIPPAVAIGSLSASQITIVRGDTLTIQLPLMGDIHLRTKLWFTAKLESQTQTSTNTDAQSVFQVTEAGGLIVLNGTTVGVTASDASLTVNDGPTGNVTLIIKGTSTAQLAVQDLVWDAQFLTPNGISTPISGNLSVVADITQAVS